MKKISSCFTFFWLIAIHLQLIGSSESNTQVDFKESWSVLKKGNFKFVDNRKYAKERAKLTKGQNPPYIVLSCSDSRAPPDIIFQQGLGELFTTRVAGQVADSVVIDSIEYAVTHYDIALIVVMGHTDCGAVIGALKHLQENDGRIDVEIGHLNAVLIPIERAIVEAGIDIYAPDALKKSIRANILYVANQLLLKSEPIREAVECGRVNIVGSEYNLKTGKVKRLFVY